MKNIIIIIIVIFILTAAGLYLEFSKDKTSFDSAGLVSGLLGEDGQFKKQGPAPEFVGLAGWLNSEPQTVAGLKGKVVLVDFWTYSCINCIRTLPYVTNWSETYKDRGLVVIGIHTPEFAFEKEKKNVQSAIERYKINYPVALDNDYKTWNNYHNRYWPAEYLIDQDGQIVYTHFGEGEYEQTENKIRSLLGLDEAEGNPIEDSRRAGSPEMYFGLERLEYLANDQGAYSQSGVYVYPENLPLNRFALKGKWHFLPESVKLTEGQGGLKLKFRAAKVFMVASSGLPAKLSITVDGQKQPDVIVSRSDLYTLFDSKDYGEHLLEISVDQAGFEAFTFTFG